MVNCNTSPRSRTQLAPSISERGKEKELIARRQVTTGPLPRRTIRTAAGLLRHWVP